MRRRSAARSAELIVKGRYETIDLSRMGYQRVLDNAPYRERGIV